LSAAEANSKRIVWLGDPLSLDSQRVGPKAAHLGSLMESFQIPSGFCIPASVYRTAGASGRLSPKLRSDISAAYERLARHSATADPSVAVRSSAVDEDGPLASFAGQHETLLNIQGIDALLEAIEETWASARSETALAYRANHGLPVDDIGLAVLVQQLVASDVSGVMFSANPVSGQQDEMMVTASWGLGESIVGGTVTPDSWIVEKSSLNLIEEQLGDKRRMTIMMEDGSGEVDVPRFLRGQPSLSAAQIQEVAQLGRRLEEFKGWPVDIEFAYAGEQLYLLQCRPITTL
jgi:phosphoenolpyruvate synthase/pyruvate phosphate dikinase